MLSWFTNVNAMSLRMRQLEARIEELEHLYGGASSQPMPTRAVHAQAQLTVPPPAATVISKPQKTEKKKRKPRRVRSFADFLYNGETITARIPIGNRIFEEVEIVYDGAMFTIMGQDISNISLNKVVQMIAKTLEDEGIRDKECKSPLNAWLLCFVVRDGIRMMLDKLSTTVGVSDEGSQCSDEAEDVEND